MKPLPALIRAVLCAGTCSAGLQADDAPAPGWIVEAESGVFSGTVDGHSCWHHVMLSDAPHSTHSGRGAVDTDNRIGSFVEVAYDAGWTGPHRVTVRYTHIKPDPRPGQLLVNGAVAATLALAQSEALPAWKTESVAVELAAGRNLLRLAALNDGGLPNVDYLKVAELRAVPAGTLPCVQVLEAEDGRFAGKEDHHSCWNFIAQIPAAHSGFTGHGLVDTENKPGSFAEVAFDSPAAGPHLLGVRYVHGKPDTRAAEVRVNGVVAHAAVPFPSTSAWTAWRYVSVPIELVAGRNVVRLVATGAEGLCNLDHFRFTPLAAVSADAPVAAPAPTPTASGPSATPASSAAVSAPLKWGNRLLQMKPEWYATAEARVAADRVLSYQSPLGGWPKNTDLLVPATAEELAKLARGDKANTIDNQATTTPIRFLARMAESTREEAYRAAVERGVDYLLRSQYANGGFPQFYPLRKGYYAHITFNDGAMINALELLRDVAEAREPFRFLDAERRARAADAVARGIDCILKTQLKQDGRPTAWCAQYDEQTLEAAWARKYEPPSYSGAESVGIVRFLLSIHDPSPEVIAAVEGAVAWFRGVALHGQRLEPVPQPSGKPDRVLVPDPTAPPLWARFYELGTNRPLYMDRESAPKYDFAQIDVERRRGYDYHGTWPARLLERDYPAWRARRARDPEHAPSAP